MVSISDLTFPQTGLSQKSNCDITAYQEDLVHYVRKRPTRKLRVVKEFLDNNLRDPNQNIEGLEREITYLYSKFCDEQAAKRQLRRMNFLKPLKPKKKKKDRNNVSAMNDYSKYLQQFADKDCNLLQEIKPDPGANAEIFKRVLIKSREMNRRPNSQEMKPRESGEESIVEKSSEKRTDRLRENLRLISSGRTDKTDTQKAMSSTQGNIISIRPQSVMLTTKRTDSQTASINWKENRGPGFDKSGTLGAILAGKKEGKEEKKKQETPSENKDIVELKEKITKYMGQKTGKKEVPFQFDKTFLANRRIQKKNQDLAVRTGLFQPSKTNMSFGL